MNLIRILNCYKQGKFVCSFLSGWNHDKNILKFDIQTIISTVTKNAQTLAINSTEELLLWFIL